MEFRGVTEIACEDFTYARTMSTGDDVEGSANLPLCSESLNEEAEFWRTTFEPLQKLPSLFEN